MHTLSLQLTQFLSHLSIFFEWKYLRYLLNIQCIDVFIFCFGYSSKKWQRCKVMRTGFVASRLRRTFHWMKPKYVMLSVNYYPFSSMLWYQWILFFLFFYI
jgi:hypothetical protein